ncbi:MAG TPA: TetR/AcrR family transcriptional regulator [Phenylobacterium sp.]|uniref:TetR/AcrR family transcriptional regulator n=1 Tax=Phenylobacterium conjunctum TaxID=1298959 RepID=A0ABW3T5J7_9CAUL|nr:TetR/AcrR family transcriptional regulator [Phenylobacterium sp.]HQN49672.1 TetR/AcrR family transcriptional regulator [Phenylobacterium sp.]
MGERVKRSERSERTRAALIAAGRRLFCERPVDAVAIDDIVQAAEVSKGSFYNHFDDREALVRAVTGDVRARVEHAVHRANAEIQDPAHRMARAVCVYLRYALDDPERAGVLVRIYSGHVSLSTPLNQGLVEDVSQGIAAGRFQVPTTESAVLLVMGVAQLSLIRIVQEPNPTVAVTLAQQMCALLLRGLGVPNPEGEAIAAQAADEIVRRGAFTPDLDGAVQ